MKTRGIVLVNRCFVLGCLLSFAGIAHGGDFRWIGGSSSGGGWNDPANWLNASEEHVCPSAGDTAIIKGEGLSVTVSDADAARMSSLKAILLNDVSSWSKRCDCTLVFNTTTNITVGCQIRGNGKAILRGDVTVELASTNTDGAYSFYEAVGIYMLIGGFTVERGTLVLAQPSMGSTLTSGYVYFNLDLAEGTTAILSSNNMTRICGLYGAGTLRQDGATQKKLYFACDGYAGDAYLTQPDFAGKLIGKVDVTVYDNQRFSGAANDFGNKSTYPATFMVIRNSSSDTCGMAWGSSFGQGFNPSSFGTDSRIFLRFGAGLGYLGNGETCDKVISMGCTTGYAQHFDGGPNGGLDFAGELKLDAWGSVITMHSFVFCGSNSAPCTMSGKLNLRGQAGSDPYIYNLYLRKEGPGTWNFKQNASSIFCGVFDVREGVLGFDTLAEAGVNCALGKATALTDEFTGVYDSSHDSPYALRLGRITQGAADAVLEFNGAADAVSTTRPLLLTGDGHLRANGTSGSAFCFSGVTSDALAGAKTLTLDGASTAANTLRQLDDSDGGSVSIVKDGVGTWTLSGKVDISGDVKVKAGTLRVAVAPFGDVPMRYFRVVLWDDTYGNTYQSYLREFAFYDKSGNRVDLGLTFHMPEGTDYGEYYSYPANYAQNLQPGECSYDYIPSETAQTYYLYKGGSALANLFDGTSVYSQFPGSFYTTKYAVSLRLRDDAPEIAYVDFSQIADHDGMDESGIRSASCFRVDGSYDGINWTNGIAQATSLPFKKGANAKWYFSSPLADVNAGQRTLDGTANGWAVSKRPVVRIDSREVLLDGVKSYSVEVGATLEAVGTDGVPPVISNLVVNAENGAGTIRGFRFADRVAVDLTTIPKGCDLDLPIDFSGCANYHPENWTFTENGMKSKRTIFIDGDRICIRRKGLTIVVR